jgi:hypothetical protein
MAAGHIKNALSCMEFQMARLTGLEKMSYARASGGEGAD